MTCSTILRACRRHRQSGDVDVLPEKDDVTVVVLTNSSVGAPIRITTRIARAALGLPPQGS